MEDEAYVRELLEILTRPVDPDLLPGHLDADWIDRHDGFGTDLRVTSIDVVPGEHGDQLDIAFVLALPDLPDHLEAPAEGSLLLPFDAEWRQISGYREPEDYAPVIASRLMHNISRHLYARKGRHGTASDLPSRDRQRELQLEVFRLWGEVEEQAPDRFVVRREGQHELTFLVTPDQWELVIGKHGTKPSWLLEHFDELVGSSPREQRFLVFWDGDLVTSTREKLPPARIPRPPLREVKRRLAEAKANGSDFGWYAYPPGGRNEELPGMESNHRR